MRAARFTGPYSDDCRRQFSSAPRSHLLNTVVVRTRPQTERATDSAIRTQGACSLRRTAVNRTPLWMRYQPALGGECAEPYRMGSRAPAALGEVRCSGTFRTSFPGSSTRADRSEFEAVTLVT